MNDTQPYLARPFIGTDDQIKAQNLLKEQFTMTTDRLKMLANDLRTEMDKGLKQENATVPMLPSWITAHPTGQEKGEYIGLELSGSMVRIYLVHLLGQGRISTRKQKYFINDDIKRGHVSKLIDFLADTVDRFLTFVDRDTSTEPIDLGFVISFPLQSQAVNKASVVRWTKDFEITGAEGKNLGELLEAGLHRRNLLVHVKAVINGVVGCLLAHNYRVLDTLVACTISTGTNAAYWEKMSKIQKIQARSQKASNGDDDQEMIINTEWGCLGESDPSILPRTLYDNKVNRQSTNPGIHHFEKMVSGLYLGEIARLIMLEFLDRRLIFDSQYTAELNKPYGFATEYASAIAEDETAELETTQHILESIMCLPSTTLNDRSVVKTICSLVGQRAARLTAGAISAIIEERGGTTGSLTISVEGDIYQYFSSFDRRVKEALRRIYGENIDLIHIGVTKDGNGIGGAIAAMLFP